MLDCVFRGGDAERRTTRGSESDVDRDEPEEKLAGLVDFDLDVRTRKGGPDGAS